MNLYVLKTSFKNVIETIQLKRLFSERAANSPVRKPIFISLPSPSPLAILTFLTNTVHSHFPHPHLATLNYPIQNSLNPPPPHHKETHRQQSAVFLHSSTIQSQTSHVEYLRSNFGQLFRQIDVFSSSVFSLPRNILAKQVCEYLRFKMAAVDSVGCGRVCSVLSFVIVFKKVLQSTISRIGSGRRPGF